MTIKIEVEEYCQECPQFHPEARAYPNGYVDPITGHGGFDTMVRCQNHYHCAHVARFFNGKAENHD